jgi:hypothetical protein
MLTNGRRTKSDDNSSHGLKAKWAKNERFLTGGENERMRKILSEIKL